jgi:endonuclease III
MFEINKVMNILKKEFNKNPFLMGEAVFYESKDIYKLLISTILSARTKDETTMKILPALFQKAGTIDKLKNLEVWEIEKLIYPVGFYKNKARFLKNLPKALERFKGNIPSTREGLMSLPGVGRKTANLVLSVGFNIPAICVDTHVHRISNRFGYIKTKEPLETELELMRLLPKKYWKYYNAYLVSHGQNICFPIKPSCKNCLLNDYCKKEGVNIGNYL